MDINILMQTECKLIILILIGWGMKKLKMIDNHQVSGLSNLLIMLLMPCSIISSFIQDNQYGVSIHEMLFIIIFTLICLVVIYAIFGHMFKKYGKDKQQILLYGIVFFNGMFIGLPVIEGLLGNQGVMYLSITQLPIKVLTWTMGLWIFESKKTDQSIVKNLFHPGIMSVILGLLIFMLHLNLPSVVTNPIVSLGNCCSSLAMVTTGAILADVELNQIKDKSLYVYCFYKLIVIPLGLFVILKPIGMSGILKQTLMIEFAMPAANFTSIMASKYNVNPEYAATLVFISVILSLFTVPILVMLI